MRSRKELIAPRMAAGCSSADAGWPDRNAWPAKDSGRVHGRVETFTRSHAWESRCRAGGAGSREPAQLDADLNDPHQEPGEEFHVERHPAPPRREAAPSA